jgi:hypothetical protein
MNNNHFGDGDRAQIMSCGDHHTPNDWVRCSTALPLGCLLILTPFDALDESPLLIQLCKVVAERLPGVEVRGADTGGGLSDRFYTSLHARLRTVDRKRIQPANNLFPFPWLGRLVSCPLKFLLQQ